MVSEQVPSWELSLRPRRPQLRPRHPHLRSSPPLPADPAALTCGLAAITCDPVALGCGPAAITCGPVARTCGPAALTCGPPAALSCGPAALTCGLAALTCGPRRPQLRPRRPLPAALPPLPAASPPLPYGPAAPHMWLCRLYLRPRLTGKRSQVSACASLCACTTHRAAEGTGAHDRAAAGGFGATGGAAGEGAPIGGTGAVPAVSGVAARPRPYFVPLLEQPTSPLPAPSPYTGPTGGLAERREPASRPASPVRAARTSGRGSRQRPPPVPGTHRMSLRPSTTPLRVPLPSPPASCLPALADPESDSLRAASPTLVDFAASCRLDYAASLVTESESVCPPSVGGECALGTDVLEDRQEEFQCLAAASPHLVSVLLTPEGDPDALDIPTPRSYAEAIEGACATTGSSNGSFPTLGGSLCLAAGAVTGRRFL
ncbi:unnamed protein product [Closterium sp. NIES-53]